MSKLRLITCATVGTLGLILFLTGLKIDNSVCTVAGDFYMLVACLALPQEVFEKILDLFSSKR